MHKVARLAMAVVAAMVLAVGIVAAQDAEVDAEELNFTLVNKTGLVVDQLYISAASADDWEEDVLGDATLADGDKMKISFEGGKAEKKWDVKIVDEEGDEVIWTELDLSEITKVTLFYTKGGKPTAKTE